MEQKIYSNGIGYDVTRLPARSLYYQLIAGKVLLPRGLISNWCADFMLSNKQIVTTFTYARDCTKNVFKQCFQYKLSTYILPTNEYLKRYRVEESELCTRCKVEKDTILHMLWECEKIILF